VERQSWGRLRLMSRANPSPRKSAGQGRPARRSGHARVRGGARSTGLLDRKSPFRSAGALSRLNTYAMLAIILLLAAAAFAPCLKNGFINLDDSSYITENSGIRSFSEANVTSWFTTFHKGNYYPLVLFTYALEYQVNGPDPFVHHALSLAIHLINCGLAFWLLLRLTGKRELSFVAAAIWAVHPLRVESVAWAAEQKDLLYVLFVFLSLGWYSGYRQNQKAGTYLLSLITTGAAPTLNWTVSTRPSRTATGPLRSARNSPLLI
jgi:hypothetical protein